MTTTGDGTLSNLVVRSVGPLKRTSSGHPYMEAETDQGIAAFWGFGEEMSNIVAVQGAALPVNVRCQPRSPAQPGRHALWVPWSSPVFITPPRAADVRGSDHDFDPEAARDELSRLGRQLGALFDQIEARTTSEGLTARAVRFSRDRLAPRRICALMVLVAELRNSAEHDRGQPFTSLQASAARTAWRAITEWFEAKSDH